VVIVVVVVVVVVVVGVVVVVVVIVVVVVLNSRVHRGIPLTFWYPSIILQPIEHLQTPGRLVANVLWKVLFEHCCGWFLCEYSSQSSY
jgi:hypothetical protein